MSNSRIEIKEKRSGLLAKGLVFLTLAVISLFFALFPYLSNYMPISSTIFYVVGGIMFCIFSTLFIYLLIRECKPNNALILTSRGFVDLTNVGANVEIEWTNVSSVKLMGKDSTPYLGIILENCDIVMDAMKKNLSYEMRENIEEGLPHILISQKSIRFSADELKELFVKFIREARVLQKDVPKHPKTNPFTSEDVLRAFGRIPEDKPAEAELDETIMYDSKTPEDISDEPNQTDGTTESTTEITSCDTSESAQEMYSTPASRGFSSVDTFYELLFQSEDNDNYTSPETEDNNEHTDEECFYNEIIVQELFINKDDTIEEIVDDGNIEDIAISAESTLETITNSFPNDEVFANTSEQVDVNATHEKDAVLSKEIDELLSQARSSKITELGKLLNEKDLPFSALRTNNIAEILRENDENDNLITQKDSTKNSLSDTKEFFPEIPEIKNI